MNIYFRIIMSALLTKSSLSHTLYKSISKRRINIESPILKMSSFNTLSGVNEFGLSTENSFVKYLTKENNEGKSQFIPRQIHKSHYTEVQPEKVPSPYLIAASKECALALKLNPNDIRSLAFVEAFSG